MAKGYPVSLSTVETIIAELKADSTQANNVIARICGVPYQVVQKIREREGFPLSTVRAAMTRVPPMTTAELKRLEDAPDQPFKRDRQEPVIYW